MVRSDPARQPCEDVRRFVALLTAEERMLVILKRELYDGHWESMVADLRARLEGRPFVFRLVHRIEDDIERIEGLRAFERLHQVDLAEHVVFEPAASEDADQGERTEHNR